MNSIIICAFRFYNSAFVHNPRSVILTESSLALSLCKRVPIYINYHAYKESSCIIMSPYAVLYNNLFCTVFCVHMYSDVHRVLE